MANEKLLNTRIQLKYDTLTNWEASSFKLKAGEIAIATLGNVRDGSSAGDVNQHPVLFKVGTGNHTFSELPYASALAADVYAWAKKSESEFVNSFLSLADTQGNTIQAKLNAIFATDAELTAAINSLRTELTGNDGLAGLTSRVKALEDDRVTEQELADAVSDAETRVAATYETIANTDLVRNRVKALEDHKDDYKAYADQAEADAIASAKTETENQVKALSDSIKDHASVDSFNDVMTEMAKYQLAGDYATKAEAQGYANAKDSAIAAAKKAGDDAAAALVAYETANNQALADEIARAKAAEAQALADAKAYANDLKDSILGEGISETFDTLKEIQTWIEGDGVNATELSGAIAAEAKVRADEDSRLAGLIDANADAIAALNAADGKVANAAYADKANSLTDAAKEEVKAVKVDNAAHADSADNAAQLGGIAADQYATKAYADQAEADAISAANANTANVIKNYYTKSEADAAFMDSTETDSAIDAKIAALDLGATYEPIGAEGRAKAYADSLAGNYATAAQGAKADSALQEITTTANGGLKVTNKNHIDIDTDVVFVFNCGSASVLVD